MNHLEYLHKNIGSNRIKVPFQALIRSGSMQEDKRSGKLVLVAHCILNQNSKVLGLAQHSNMIFEIVELLMEKDYGIIQMPCPELTFAGLLRWSQTREQYDTSMFRRHCRKIAIQLVDQIIEYVKNGMEVPAIIGIEGSPSCGINRTYVGYKGGDAGKAGRAKKKLTEKPGIFIEEIVSEAEKRGLSISLCGLDEKRIKQSMKKILLVLKG